MPDYPEPSIDYRDKESGSTTFNQCGWCRYAMGTHRYNYCIEGKCHLMRSYSPDIHWDDPCVFLSASENELSGFIKSHEYYIKSAQNEIERRKEYIKILSGLKATAVYRPPLPSDRKHDHFNIDEPVAVYFKDKQQWFFGKVARGYRHHDGCVSYCLEGIGPQEGNFWGCGVAVPIVLLKTEYDWFKQNPKEYAIWCSRAYKDKFNGQAIEVARIEGGNDA